MSTSNDLKSQITKELHTGSRGEIQLFAKNQFNATCRRLIKVSLHRLGQFNTIVEAI